MVLQVKDSRKAKKLSFQQGLCQQFFRACLDRHTATLYAAGPGEEGEAQREGIQREENIQIPAELTKSQSEIVSALPEKKINYIYIERERDKSYFQ